MQFDSTSFEGLKVVTPRVFGDARGYFFESYNDQTFKQAGLDFDWVQDNQSHSSYGVIRGLQGEILDVVVDLRKDQATYGKVYSIVLSADNKQQLFVPRGFAHGFSVLSETADVMYKCDALYDKQSEAGICYNDPILAIDWKIPMSKAKVSEKDVILPGFADCDSNF